MKIIYKHTGDAVAFINTEFMYTIEGGYCIGKIIDSHVYKMTGEYVGEIFEDMIVDKHLGQLGSLGQIGDPGRIGSPGNPGNRGIRITGFEDRFDRLLEGAQFF